MAERRFLGVTVMPEYVQTEGIDKVLDNLAALGGSMRAPCRSMAWPTATGQPTISASA
jgi:hypothetical protein